MADSDVVARIKRFNRGRDPHLLARKYAAIQSNAFTFYRGTCHLFYEYWPHGSSLDNAPLVWASGDLHPENFGSYRGRDGAVYFDVNDFDEAVLGICLWDVVRCMSGIIVGSRAFGVFEDDAFALGCRYLYAYYARLAEGSPRSITADVSRGLVHDLLRGVRLRSNAMLVASRVKRKGKKRCILVDGVHAATLGAAERERAERVFASWNEARKRKARFDLVDVAERIAGIGSLGTARYVALAHRNGAWYLLDVKQEGAAFAQAFVTAAQPTWESQAARVVWVQTRARRSRHHRSRALSTVSNPT